LSEVFAVSIVIPLIWLIFREHNVQFELAAERRQFRNTVWQAAQAMPVCRAKLGTADAGTAHSRRKQSKSGGCRLRFTASDFGIDSSLP